MSYNHISLVRYLLSQGGDLKLVDQDGDTPLLACETTEMFDLLVEAGADPMATNFIGETLQQVMNATLIIHSRND